MEIPKTSFFYFVRNFFPNGKVYIFRIFLTLEEWFVSIFGTFKLKFGRHGTNKKKCSKKIPHATAQYADSLSEKPTYPIAYVRVLV